MSVFLEPIAIVLFFFSFSNPRRYSGRKATAVFSLLCSEPGKITATKRKDFIDFDVHNLKNKTQIFFY